MSLDRSQIFKLPWSKSDNPGAWVEVTGMLIAVIGVIKGEIYGLSTTVVVEGGKITLILVIVVKAWNLRVTGCGKLIIGGEGFKREYIPEYPCISSLVRIIGGNIGE